IALRRTFIDDARAQFLQQPFLAKPDRMIAGIGIFREISQRNPFAARDQWGNHIAQTLGLRADKVNSHPRNLRGPSQIEAVRRPCKRDCTESHPLATRKRVELALAPLWEPMVNRLNKPLQAAFFPFSKAPPAMNTPNPRPSLRAFERLVADR